MKKSGHLSCLGFLLTLVLVGMAQAVFAAGASNDWNNSWGSNLDSSARAVMIQQANAIALRESDYYGSFGPATSNYVNSGNSSYVNNSTNNSQTTNTNPLTYSTTSVGVMNSPTATINGNNSSLNTTNSTSSSGGMQSTISH